MEKHIEVYLRKEVKKRKGLALKFVSPGFTGVPDRIVLLPGAIVVFCEMKNTGKKPKPRQQHVHKQLRDLGFRVEVPDSKEKVNKLLDEIYPL